MASLDYFLLCESVISDTAGKLTIINIFNGVSAPKLPTTHQKFALTFNITPTVDDIKDGKIEYSVEILGPDGERLVKADGEVEYGDDMMNGVFGLSGTLDLSGQLVLNKYGNHTAKLFLNGSEFTTRLFNVMETPGGTQ